MGRGVEFCEHLFRQCLPPGETSFRGFSFYKSLQVIFPQPEGAGPGIPAARKTVHTSFLNGHRENHTLVSKMCSYYYKGVTFCSDYFFFFKSMLESFVKMSFVKMNFKTFYNRWWWWLSR